MQLLYLWSILHKWIMFCVWPFVITTGYVRMCMLLHRWRKLTNFGGAVLKKQIRLHALHLSTLCRFFSPSALKVLPPMYCMCGCNLWPPLLHVVHRLDDISDGTLITSPLLFWCPLWVCANAIELRDLVCCLVACFSAVTSHAEWADGGGCGAGEKLESV